MSTENWVSIASLKEPFNDAVNYKSKAEKAFFLKLFLKTDELKKCLSPSVYYLMGEKGAGKTAYAVYLENNEIDNNRCKLTTMTETQYKRFIALKREGKLAYSDYANIWRSMLLLVVSQMIIEKSKTFFHSLTGKFSNVERAVAQWNSKALNPEIEGAFEVLKSDRLSSTLKNDLIGETSGEHQNQHTEKSSNIRHHLLETESALKEAICDLKLSRSHVLFIDGIDFRPESVPYVDYIECIKGLSEAAWQLNAEFFNSIKDSPGRIKIVLLVRPDVFHMLNLYNSNSRLQDNCVFLDWATTEREYRSSRLQEVSGRYFSSQQFNGASEIDSWNQYFNGEKDAERIFKNLLKTTFQKPRDILTFIKIIRRNQVKIGKGNEHIFDIKRIVDANVTREFADYMLGEVRNYASFYMTPQDFAIYLKFFQYLNGKSRFSWVQFEDAFNNFFKWVSGEEVKCREYLRDSESLLQFFYEVNVIGYRETAIKDGEEFYHWAYRERSINNISPKIKATEIMVLNPGIAKALDIGKETSAHNFSQKQRSYKSTNPQKYRRKKRR